MSTGREDSQLTYFLVYYKTTTAVRPFGGRIVFFSLCSVVYPLWVQYLPIVSDHITRNRETTGYFVHRYCFWATDDIRGGRCRCLSETIKMAPRCRLSSTNRVILGYFVHFVHFVHFLIFLNF